jgi:hypothetical protein
MTSPHGPYGVGYRRAARILNRMMQSRKKELNTKRYYCTNYGLELAHMKQEFRVIAHHYGAVKSLPWMY